MRIYEIVDSEQKMSIGCLMYFEKEKSYTIELQSYLDEWNAPILFANRVKNGKYTIGRELSRLWVNERVIPSGRQNIDSILVNAKMMAYDEMELLDKASGRCSQDSMYIRRLDAIPEFVRERMKHSIVECVLCDDFSLLCFFADGMIRKVSLLEIQGEPNAKKVIGNEELFKSGHVAAGGYCITFNDSIDLESFILYESGIQIPLTHSDFIAFVNTNIVDSSETCDILECSRQNLTNYLSNNTIVPIKKNVKGNLYTKGNIYRQEIIAKL